MTNEEYIALWEKRELLRQERINLLIDAENTIDDLCKQRFRELHPRSKRNLDNIKGFSILPSDEVDFISAPTVNYIREKRDEIDYEIDQIKNQLEINAQYILPTISTEIYTLVTKDGADYRTVGFGCNAYAKTWVEYFKQFLDVHNIPCAIFIESRRVKSVHSEMIYNLYELTGNCHPAIFYALSRQSPEGTLDFIAFCNKMAVNVKVYTGG